jgi:hypothetical protein
MVGVPTDFHELLPLHNGNIVLMSYVAKEGVDLTGISGQPTAGPNSTIADCVLQEIDRQGNVVWEWTGSEHLDPVTESTVAPVSGGVYDVFHCNSIDVHANGNVLVSARHLDAIFEIRRSDGEIVWKMGGAPVNKDGATIIDIVNDPYDGIVQQHDARYLPNGNVSLFDNQNAQTNHPPRAVKFSVNLATNTAEPVFSFAAPDAVRACCQGSFRRYPDGHSRIGWGFFVPFNGVAITEIDEAGNALLNVNFPAGVASYRGVKVPTRNFDVNVLRNTAGR